ncbi:unnamed protein product, partial [Closterium sp. NIES-53]
YLGNNLLTGTIPDFSSLSYINFLGLSYNSLTGPIPSSIGKLSQLCYLALKWNSLTGPIPYALQSLTNLQYLDLVSNQLSGTIPDWFTSFPILILLDLSYNKFTGTIPSSVGSLTLLEGLSFSHNQLYGSIPEALTSLTKLFTFDLSHNYLTGAGLKPKQAYADLSFNYLSGPIHECSSTNYDANCIAVTGACLSQMRPESVCNSFCGISGTSAACAGHGVCYPTGASLRPACACDQGFKVVDGLTCVPEEQDDGYSFTNTIVPPQTELTKGTRQETVGKFAEDPVMLFLYGQGQEDPGCGTELAFNVNFTFSLSPKPGKAGANGFAFVISAKDRPGNSGSGVGYGGVEIRSMAIEFDTFQDPKNGDPDYQHIGLNVQGRDVSVATAKAPFVLNDRRQYTAWVDYEPGDPGTIQVFLANSTAKPRVAVLERRFSLCEVLQPGPPQVEQGEEAQLQAYYVGFVASTTVAPFQKHMVLDSWVHAGLPPPRKPVNIVPTYGLNVSVETYAPQQASPFPRYVSADYRVAADKKDSWRFSDYHSWDSVPFLGWPVKDQTTCSACWAYAVVASIEAAYGIATRQEAPRLSVDSLFTLMGLTTAADRCSAGGSPTEAFEKLRALPKDGLVLAGTGASQTSKDTRYPIQGFERTFFKGYMGLMLAVQRQPVVVHIQATTQSFLEYDGTFKYQDPQCYSANLNHVVLVVGYFIFRDDGSQNRIAPPFWIVRNSWGVEWGDRGHMRMDIQGGDGVCGINVLPGIVPIVKIPKDPCGLRSYKGDGDVQPTMNPCGRFTCRPIPKNDTNSCDCVIPEEPKQPFAEVANGYGANTCAYVDVCGSYFKNPCAVGTCINDGKGAYSCICPPTYILSRTILNFPSCDPVNVTATSIAVSGVNWRCSDVYPIVGISYNQFRQQNPQVDCTKPLAINTTLSVGGSPEVPCTSYFYALQGDTCRSMAYQLIMTRSKLIELNPGLDCAVPIKPGRSVCIERSAAYAYTVPLCLKYGVMLAQDSCERMLQGLAGDVNATTWAMLYRTNPGLVCSQVIPTSIAAVGSNIGVQVCLRVEYWPFTLGRCNKGRAKNVSPTLSCPGAYSFYDADKKKASAKFTTYNGNACAGNVGGKFICVP